MPVRVETRYDTLIARREARDGDRVAVSVGTSLLVADALNEVGAEGSLAAMVGDLPTYPIRRESV